MELLLKICPCAIHHANRWAISRKQHCLVLLSEPAEIEGGDPVGHEEQEAALSSGHQALLLGQAGLVQKGTSGDELRQWRMAPYLDAVLQQKRSRFLIRLSAQLLR